MPSCEKTKYASLVRPWMRELSCAAKLCPLKTISRTSNRWTNDSERRWRTTLGLRSRTRYLVSSTSVIMLLIQHASYISSSTLSTNITDTVERITRSTSLAEFIHTIPAPSNMVQVHISQKTPKKKMTHRAGKEWWMIMIRSPISVLSFLPIVSPSPPAWCVEKRASRAAFHMPGILLSIRVTKMKVAHVCSIHGCAHKSMFRSIWICFSKSRQWRTSSCVEKTDCTKMLVATIGRVMAKAFSKPACSAT
mmetsp:Transcript_54535/g.88401  ORF Transcript_54535/g.88401 Transcript_54535/m.88401 type:complete len:250 (+) Transcript_54535:166-915(+)